VIKQRYLAIPFVLAFVVAVVFAFFYFERGQDVDSVRAFVRLAELPPGTENLAIEEVRLPDRTEYRLRFEAEPEGVQGWLERSPATEGLPGEATESGGLRYEVLGSEGERKAWVVVGPEGRRVLVEAFWPQQ